MHILSLAWRYASRRLVNYVAVLAIAIALTVQIVAGGILDGMIEGFKLRVRGLGEQIVVRFGAPPLPRPVFDALAQDLLRQFPDELEGVTPFLPQYTLVQPAAGRSAYELATVWAVDLAEEAKYSSLPKHLLTFRLDPDHPSWFAPGDEPRGRKPLFMGATMAEYLGVSPGDAVDIVYARRRAGSDGAGDFEPVTARHVVTALYKSGAWRRDGFGVYIPLSEGMPFFQGGGRPAAGVKVAVPQMVCWLKDPQRASELETSVRAAVERHLAAAGLHPPPTADNAGRWISSSNWQDAQAGTIALMRNENNLVELVLVLYMFSGGFCVFAILSTLVGRRVRDIGLLRCVGAGRGTVLAVFLGVGLWIGALGTALGTAGGLWLLGSGGEDPPRPRVDVYYEAVVGQSMYPTDMYGGEGMPVVVGAGKIALYAGGALLVTVLSALYPALWAATREPMAALRDEE